MSDAKTEEAKGAEVDAPKPAPKGRRGRRGTVCAVPVSVEEGWAPPVIYKSDEARKRIQETIVNNILFSGLDHAEREIVVAAMEEKTFKSGDVLIKQGDVGDFFYVLESGHCEITVNGKVVMECGPGTSFGELALMYDAPRAATVTATADCVTWAVDQLTFKKTIMDATTKKRARHEAFIAAVPILSTLNSYERLTIADALKQQEFGEGKVVIAEGDEGHEFFIIEKGEVECTKAGVDVEVSRRLTAGDYFGERALLTDEARAATVTAVSDLVLQSLDRATFKRLLGPLDAIMRGNMDVYNKYKDAIPSGDHVLAEDAGGKEDEDDDDEDEGGTTAPAGGAAAPASATDEPAAAP